MIAITTFSKSGYELYGKRLLESLIEFWPGQVLCYYDEPAIESPKIIYKSLANVFGHDQFIEYCKRSPVFQGKLLTTYSYTYDAVRFCHKAFAQFDALQGNRGKLFWIDGDSELLRPMPEQLLREIFAGTGLSILSRPGFYTETGFVGFDTEKEKFKEFLDAYISMYRKGLIFTLAGWHDCYALDQAINISQIPYNDLVGGWKFGDDLDVMPKTVLNDYLIHHKGGKKFTRPRINGDAAQPALPLGAS